jgi:hypothetical protein
MITSGHSCKSVISIAVFDGQRMAFGHELSVDLEKRQRKRGIDTRALSPTISVAPPFATSSTRV